MEQLCLDTGGHPSIDSCCIDANDYPNLCLVGACGCSPDNSESTKVCDCVGSNNCFDSEFGCVDKSMWMNCEDNGGYLDTQGTCNGDPFPTTCLAKGEVGGPFDCYPGIDTTVCACSRSALCYVQGVGCVASDEAGLCLASGGEIIVRAACNGVRSMPTTCLAKNEVGGPFDCGSTSNMQPTCECPGSKCFVQGVGCVESKKAGECLIDDGEIQLDSCCKMSGDFPDICSNGACSCSDSDSVDTAICSCPYGGCWDGRKCR